jgi:citrate synthase
MVLMTPLSLANQEVLRWQLEMQEKIGSDKITHDTIKDYLWETLKGGRVVPGSAYFGYHLTPLVLILAFGHRYGHGVLRSPDPRFIALQEFCDKRPELLASPTIQLVKQTYEVAPGVLTEHGKTKNPWPNVDAASGCVLYHYGLTEFKVSWLGDWFLSRNLPLSVLHGHFRCFSR